MVHAVGPARHGLHGVDRGRAVGAFVVGVVFLGEAANAPRLMAASLIVGGLLLMKLSSPA